MRQGGSISWNPKGARAVDDRIVRRTAFSPTR
jgi:hypothetical protein